MALKFDEILSAQIGVGTDDPLQKLQVAGPAYFSGGTNASFGDGGDVQSSTAIIIDKGDRIKVRDGVYLRDLLHQDSTNGLIKIGQSGTSLIRGISLEAGHDGDAAGAQVRVYGGGTEYVRFDGYNKRMGIGTTSPIDLLHIKSTTTDARAVLDGATGFDAELKFAENGDVKYTIGHDAATDSFVIGTTNVDTDARLVIDSTGEVGIGTSAPAAKFSVAQPTSGDTTVLLGRRSGKSSIKSDTTEGGYLILDSAANAVALNHYSNNNVWLVTGGGNVGVGTTSPSAKLDVDGTYILNGQEGLAVRSIDDTNYYSFNDYSTTADFEQQLPKTSGSGTVAKVDDSTAPAAGCFEITGNYYSEGGSNQDYIKVDVNSDYTWEMYVKFVSGSDTAQGLYLGWTMYNSSKSSFGNTQRYWGAANVRVDANSNNSDWVLVRGTIHGVGSSTGNFISGTEYVKPVILINYNDNANVIRVCGIRLYKSAKNATKIQLGRSGASSVATLNVNTEYPQFRTTLENNGNDGMRVRNDHGYIEIGSLNSGHAHIQTDRSNFYFNKRLLVDEGIISSYNEDLNLQTSQTTRLTINNSTGNVGIGVAPISNARLVTLGNQSFGIPGNGSNTSGRFLSIEGNTDSVGEGSGRIFFTEHNNTPASMDKYGLSIAYRGGSTSIVGASGNTWSGGLSNISNGEWAIFGHDNNADGVRIIRGDRAGSYVATYSNNVERFRVNSSGATVNGHLTTDNNGSDRSFRAYSDDGKFTEMRGYGIQTDREYAYFRPTTHDLQQLFIGASTLRWTNVTIDTDSAVRFNRGGNNFALLTHQYMKLPAGTTAERNSYTSGAAGFIRFNTTTSEFEGHNGTEWTNVGGGDDYSPKAITKNGSNQFVFSLADAVNFSFSATGVWTMVPTIASGDIGKSGVIIINNTGTTAPGALPAAFKTPNGDAIVWETDSGDTAIISYFVVSTSVVLINYIGNFS